MSTNGALNRKLRMGLVGGGQGAFIGRVHCTAAVLDNRAALVAGALSSDPAKGQGLGRRLRHPARAGLRLVRRNARRRGEAARRQADRLRHRRHAQPHAFRNRQGGARSRLQRDLRQAADLRSRPGREVGHDRRPLGRRLRRHAQLHRLSAGAAGAADDSVGRAGRDQRRPRQLHPGLAAHAAGAGKSEAGLLAHRSDEERRRRLLRRHRHARLQPGPLHDRLATRVGRPAI